MRSFFLDSALAVLVALCGCSDMGTTNPDMTMPTPKPPAMHRPMALTCPMDRPPGGTSTGMTGCKSDADCTDGTKGKNGRCTISRIGYTCTYDTCFTDAECSGKPCECRAAATSASADTNHCLADGNCVTDSDCGAGGFCSPTLGSCGNYTGIVAYYCHSAKDACTDDADCHKDGGIGGYCAYDKLTSSWQCSTSQCAG